MSKVVFVGNVPYNMGEEQLIDAFKSVGQVVGFRLVYDRETGKPKGYGFCEFADHDTALSAVRNLNGQEIGGRPLRIDLADSDPFLEGKTTVRGELVDGGETRAQWRERQGDRDEPRRHGQGDFLSQLPPGVPLPPGTSSMDHISNFLAATQPSQILEVLAQMKAFIITHPEQARALLVAHPQLGYALFQALLINKIVDPAILERMLAATGTSSAPPARPPPPQAAPYNPPPAHQPPPGFGAPHMHMPPPPVGPALHPSAAPAPPMYSHPAPAAHMPPPAVPYYQAPPPQAPAPVQPPVAPAAPAAQAFDPASREMLLQVLNLSQDQVNSLPPTERDQIYQLRKQFGVPLPTS